MDFQQNSKALQEIFGSPQFMATTLDTESGQGECRKVVTLLG